MKLFYGLLRPFSDRRRRRRMALFEATMGPLRDVRIIDLGGQPMIWRDIDQPLQITMLNLPGIAEKAHPSHHQITHVDGDACRVEFPDRSFDIVFSNSVVEHVGDSDKQSQFAFEARRLGKAYWVQTPSKWFPIEAHCGMPFWWFYPEFIRRVFIDRWRPKLSEWTEMVETTRVLTKRDMRRLFPDAVVVTERFWGIPKSYMAMKPRQTN